MCWFTEWIVHDRRDPAMHQAIALAEVLLAVAVVAGHNIYHVVPNEILVLAVVGALSLALRRQSLGSIGFRVPESWTRTFLIALAVAIGLQLLSTYVSEPLIRRFTGESSDLSQFRDITGDIQITLVWLAIAWTFAAFGEEFVYRGYILNRMAETLGGTHLAVWVAVFGTALLFGIGITVGPAGMIDTGISALVFGALYIWSGRNLWLPILTHGLTDTIAIVLIFFGLIQI